MSLSMFSDDEFLKYMKDVFLDEQINEYSRELKIMRMLQYRYEDEMSKKEKMYNHIYQK